MSNYTATKNACKLCSPLGAALVFRGIEGCLSILHGSQGCATYIRRYLISHFKEPVDIASSSFTEDTAVFGGSRNLKLAIDNVVRQYNPGIIGIATTCLSETIGDDVEMILKEYDEEKSPGDTPPVIHVSTPSYKGTHMNGYYAAIKAAVSHLAEKSGPGKRLNFFSGMISPADIRYMKEILDDFGIEYTFLPDYSETLDGGLWEEYKRIPPGGTSLEDIRRTGGSCLTIEAGLLPESGDSAACFLKESFGIPFKNIPLPVGINATDLFFGLLEEFTGKQMPEKHRKERARLIDSYVDGHKYLFGIRVLVYGEEGFAAAVSAFLSEIGIIPAIIATGGNSGVLEKALKESLPRNITDQTVILQDADFENIREAVEKGGIDIIIGNSKGYKISREKKIPLIRTGFPIHDRFGAQRTMYTGYRGTQMLFDRIVNAVIEQRQDASATGYSYI